MGNTIEFYSLSFIAKTLGITLTTTRSNAFKNRFGRLVVSNNSGICAGVLKSDFDAFLASIKDCTSWKEAKKKCASVVSEK